MKKFLIILALALPIGAAAQMVPPPQVGHVTMSDLDGFLKAYYGSRDEDAAKGMVDALDGSHRLRTGFRRSVLDGQSVYYEQYQIHASLTADIDSTGFQSIWHEGSTRKTGAAFVARESLSKDTFIEYIDFAEEGFVAVSSLIGSKKKDASQKAGSALLTVNYTPVQVHFKEIRQLSEVCEGGAGEVEIVLTDIGNAYAMDGYAVDVSSSDIGVLTVSPARVATGGDGSAKIRVCGVKKGKALVKVSISLHEDKTNSHVFSERELEIEVKGPERWEYVIEVHDAITEPAHNYTLTGTFAVSQALLPDKVSVHLKDVSEVSKSDGGTFEVQGEFCDTLDRREPVGLIFDPEGMAKRAVQKAYNIDGDIAQLLGDVLQSIASEQVVGQEVDSHYPLTTVLFLLEEGSWPYEIGFEDLERIGFAIESAPEGKEVEVVQKRQLAYVKEHHVLPFPDMAQHLSINLKNWYLTYEKNGEKGFGSMTGRLTLRRLPDE